MTPYDPEWDSWADTDPSDGDGDRVTPDEYSECSVCGDTFDNTDYVDVFTRPDGATICERCVPLELETVTCSECGRVGSEAAACWYMATPVCPECFVGPAA